MRCASSRQEDDAASTPGRSAVLVNEDLLDRKAEHLPDPERQRQTRIVLAVLDRVDRLPRNPETFREVRLRPAPLGSQHANPVLHSCRLAKTASAAPRTTSASPNRAAANTPFTSCASPASA